MIHIFGTPLGGKCAERPQFMRGRVVLIPWLNPEDLEIAKLEARNFVCDNSAYTAWRQGTPITDWHPYYDWLRGFYRHPKFQWAAMPDVIDGSEEENDRLIEEWPCDLRHVGVPVYHMHESPARARRLAKTFPLIALGSSGDYDRNFGEPVWFDRIDEIMEAICDDEGQPLCKLHGMRMLDPDIFTKIPLASADSTNVAQNASREAKRHNVSLPTARQIIAERVEFQSSAPRWRWRKRQLSLLGCAG